MADHAQEEPAWVSPCDSNRGGSHCGSPACEHQNIEDETNIVVTRKNRDHRKDYNKVHADENENPLTNQQPDEADRMRLGAAFVHVRIPLLVIAIVGFWFAGCERADPSLKNAP